MMKLVKGSKGELGCDISYYQGNVEFNKMKRAGIKFVIIRAGFGQSVDKRFVTYINAAIKAGLKVGVYWFIYAGNTYISQLNAQKMISVINPYKNQITCGVWADWEYDSDRCAGALTTAKRCAIVKAFLDEMTAKGYEVGIYSNQDYIKSGKFSSALISAYPLWFAQYASKMSAYSQKGKDGQAYMWQFTSSGKGSQYGVSSSALDLDYAYFEDSNVRTDTILDKVQSNPNVIKASDNPYQEPQRMLYYNPRVYMRYGDDVKWVQWHLWRFGLFLDQQGRPDANQIDGQFGPGTQKAVIEAQKRLGFAGVEIDGIVGPNTIMKFKSV